MLLLPWFVCCFAEPSEVSLVYFSLQMVPSEKIVLDISWEAVSPGSLSLAAHFAVLQEGTRAPFFRALYNGYFYAWPHILQHTAFMAVPPSPSCFLTRYPTGIWEIWEAQVVLHTPRQPQDVPVLHLPAASSAVLPGEVG